MTTAGRRTGFRLVGAAAAALLLATCRCEDGAPARPEGETGPREPLAESAAEPSPSGAGPELPAVEAAWAVVDAGDLAAEVAAYPGLAACAAALRERLPAPVVEVLADVGFADVAVDACRGLEAIATRSPEACAGLAVRYGRLGCFRRYAMFHGEPDLCPVEPVHGGRDPVCVAVAMRDPSMCLAASPEDRLGLCRAIVLRSERPCRAVSRTAPEAAGCAAAARRWWGAMPADRPRPALPHGFAPHMTLELAHPEADAGPGRHESSGLLDRGIVLGGEDDGLVLGGRHQPAIGPQPPLLELRVPRPTGELPQTYEVGPPGARAWLQLDRDAPLSSEDESLAGTVTLERFTAARGGIVEGSAELRVVASGHGTRRLEARFLTFVRDVRAGDQ